MVYLIEILYIDNFDARQKHSFRPNPKLAILAAHIGDLALSGARLETASISGTAPLCNCYVGETDSKMYTNKPEQLPFYKVLTFSGFLSVSDKSKLTISEINLRLYEKFEIKRKNV